MGAAAMRQDCNYQLDTPKLGSKRSKSFFFMKKKRKMFGRVSGFGQGCSGFWSLDAPIVPFDLLFSLDPHYYLHLCHVSPDCI
jgi:hypothetical protein